MTKIICEYTKISENKIEYQFIKNDKTRLTYKEFLYLLKSENEGFLKVFFGALNSATKELSAYLWECPPVSKETVDQPFEFVVIRSEALNSIVQDPSSFREHLNKNNNYQQKDVISFLNLNRDAILVVPNLRTNEYGFKSDYKNISKFTENASLEQQQSFWREVANKLSEELEKSKDPKWLSTHGLGVPYLHVRIDKYPKYYRFEKYRIFDRRVIEQSTQKVLGFGELEVFRHFSDDEFRDVEERERIDKNSARQERKEGSSFGWAGKLMGKIGGVKKTTIQGDFPKQSSQVLKLDSQQQQGGYQKSSKWSTQELSGYQGMWSDHNNQLQYQEEIKILKEKLAKAEEGWRIFYQKAEEIEKQKTKDTSYYQQRVNDFKNKLVEKDNQIDNLTRQLANQVERLEEQISKVCESFLDLQSELKIKEGENKELKLLVGELEKEQTEIKNQIEQLPKK